MTDGVSPLLRELMGLTGWSCVKRGVSSMISTGFQTLLPHYQRPPPPPLLSPPVEPSVPPGSPTHPETPEPPPSHERSVSSLTPSADPRSRSRSTKFRPLQRVFLTTKLDYCVHPLDPRLVELSDRITYTILVQPSTGVYSIRYVTVSKLGETETRRLYGRGGGPIGTGRTFCHGGDPSEGPKECNQLLVQ